MIEVPAGEFEMGCALGGRDDECAEAAHPKHRVALSAYLIDRTEVTVGAYRACHDAGACKSDGLTTQLDLLSYEVDCNWGKAGKDAHPMNCVDWVKAAAYCAWAGGRLPTEAEWEKAARGTDGRIYPWGNELAPGREKRECLVTVDLGYPITSTWPVGSCPAGRSPYGALDMAGNVLEWTADWFARETYTRAPRRDPRGPATGTYRVLRGDVDRRLMQASRRMKLAPTARSGRIGFRCARSAQ